MGLVRYILTAAWREVGVLARIAYIAAVAGPASMAAVASWTGWTWGVGLPWWAWAIVALLAAFIGLTAAIGKRAQRLEEETNPRLTITGFAAPRRGDEYFVRVQIYNKSSINAIQTIAPYLRDIDADDLVDENMFHLDLPIPLYSQDRLRERLLGISDTPPRPLTLRVGQPKWLEIFQIPRGSYGLINLPAPQGRTSIKLRDRMQFYCEVYGWGPRLDFSVTYDHESDSTACLSLLDERGSTVKQVRVDLASVSVSGPR